MVIVVITTVLVEMSGVDHLKFPEHLSYSQIYTLKDIVKVIDKFSKLMSDHLAGINVRLIDYKL